MSGLDGHSFERLSAISLSDGGNSNAGHVLDAVNAPCGGVDCVQGMRDDRHSRGVRFARNRGEEIPLYVLGQLYAIGLALERRNSLFRAGRSLHGGEVAARKRAAGQGISVRVVSN